MKNKFFTVTFGILLIYLFSGCSDELSPETKAYIAEVEQHRAEVNDYMKDNPASPFNAKGKIEFHQLNYFDVNPELQFKSKLYEYNPKDTVTIYGTKGEARTSVRYGYVLFPYQNETHKINVYQGQTINGEMYYSIWFTDETTNVESYGVGRYLNFEKMEDPDHTYTVDLNYAYNPYCAYSKDYSCAIPTKEDHINAAITAGEKKFHD